IKIVVLPAVNGGKDGKYCIPGGAPWQMQTVIEPGMRYKWSSIAGSPTTPPPFMDDDTLARPKVRPAVYTTYVVEGSVYSGPFRCTSRDTVNVAISSPLIEISAGKDQTVCANKAIMLNGTVSDASLVDSVNWTPSATLNDSTILTPMATPYVTTDYILYVQDQNGCGIMDTTRLIVDGFQPMIAPFASRDTVCPDGFTQLFANVSQQPCGIAQSACAGGIPEDKLLGTGTIGSVAPTPFYHIANSAGERIQMLYQRDELLGLGIKAGFINSMSFNIPAKNTTDSFYKFTIKLACTPDNSMSGSTLTSYPGSATMFSPRSVATQTGWNTFEFDNAYYWDGASNLMVEICWSKVYGEYGGGPDGVFASNTGFTSVKYIRDYSLPAPAMGEGCGLTAGTVLLSSTRPNTRFNVCIPASIFKYSWTPASYLSQPDSAVTNAEGIKEDLNYTVTVTSSSNPNCYTSGVVAVRIDHTNSVTALPVSPVISCRPGYFYDLEAYGNGPRPLRNLPCGTGNPLNCVTLVENKIGNPGTSAVVDEPKKHAFNGTYTTAHTQYIIPKSAMHNGKITSGTIRQISFEAVSASGMDFTNLKIGMKCTDTKQFSGSAPVSFESGAVNVYTGSRVFGGGKEIFTLTTPYNWDTTKNLLIDICYSQATAGTGPTLKTYNTKGFNLMVQSYQTSGDVCSNPSTEIGPEVYEVLPVFELGYCSAGDTDFTYHWSPGNYFQDSVAQKPVLQIDSTVKVFVNTVGRNGCVVKDSVTIVVPRNRRGITGDTVMCLNESIQLRSYSGVKTQWFESTPNATYDAVRTLSCDSCERTIANPKQTTTYYASVTDENGCIDTFRTTVTVKPLPAVNIVNRDTVIKYGSSIVLNAFGGTQYFWTPIAGLSNPNNVNPTAQPLVTTTYYVSGIGLNGCRGDDSVKIRVDYKSPISVPSGFTPNGDGQNDKFRLMGVTFQSLMEFRVYNRWGQEVFTTNNISDGWDGTYKGKAQDMGAYNYIIRVGYPDGTTETFKGDVTLIR
ncbi:MAG: gliding motility-associated C-terminal domain-containing protein, partial [Chitinophagaceae bacterium]|nr:gliding motility-associated C-terminal domain-containing protein [Chitinophagaceae bacterium]